VLDVVAVAPSLEKARQAAYDAVAVIELDGSHHRTDIALRAERGEITAG
jgi:phosphoribosylamine--glycine ligase